MKPPRQQALFDDDPSSDSAASLVSVPRGKERLSAGQRTFNRLTERIRRTREALTVWEAFMPRFQARVATELSTLDQEVRVAQRRLAIQCGILLAADKPGERLTRKQRGKLRRTLLDVAGEVLQDGPDAELEALYDRHSDTPYADERAVQLELTEAMLEEVFGEEGVEGHDARTVEERLRQAGERLSDAHTRDPDANAGRTAARHKKRKDEQTAAAQDAAQTSVREVYRKLVSSVHPDREGDPAERERKTALMQRANEAYDRNDLLELLALQIEIEQIDPAALANLPEKRLAHYNAVLKEQVQLLESQMQAHIDLFRAAFELPMHPITPQGVDRALSAKIAEGRSLIARIERTLERLSDPKERRFVIDELPDPDADEPDLVELLALTEAFGSRSAAPEPGAGRRRRRKR